MVSIFGNSVERCKKLCESFGMTNRNNLTYRDGLKRCNTCSVFVPPEIKGYKCPCCHNRLKTKPNTDHHIIWDDKVSCGARIVRTRRHKRY